MSAGSILQSEEKSGSNVKMILIAASAFVVLLTAGYTAYWISSPPAPGRKSSD